MRQTGRTSRIVDYITTQLFEVGQCIATDHIIFEFKITNNHMLNYLIDKVKKNVEFKSNGKDTIRHEIIEVGANGEKFMMVYFKMIMTNE